MYSSKVFPTLHTSVATRHWYGVEDNIIGSGNGYGPLVHWGEDELSSFIGFPPVSINFSTFLTYFSCNIFHFFPSNLVFLQPASMCRCSSNRFLWFLLIPQA